MPPLRLDTRKIGHPLRPAWAGNEESPTPFEVRIFRLVGAELDAFEAAVTEVLKPWPPEPRALAEVLAKGLEGPLTVAGYLELVAGDGRTVVVKDRDLEGLLELADGEPFIPGGLVYEILSLVGQVRRMSKAAEGESARRRGGAGTTGTQPTPTAASPAPPAAGSAGASSEKASTS